MNYLVLFFLSIALVTANAQDNAVIRAKQYNLENKLALQGYDPVSYFSGKPQKGKKEIAFTYMGIVYHFSSQENLTTFKANPSRFEPAYGGWCAYAMGNSGEKVEVDPETFKIIDGKLYLFYNAFFTNTLKDWNKDELNLKKKADVNWKGWILK
jgi:YHS domain-containing protein